MEKKTLIIYPPSTSNIDGAYYILDPETGEVLASHWCSHPGFAPGDLHNNRPERKEEWKEKFGMETEAKFIDETEYNWDTIYRKNQESAEKHKEVTE